MYLDPIPRLYYVVLVYPRVLLCPPLGPLRLPNKIQVYLSDLPLLLKRFVAIVDSIVMIIIDPYYLRCDPLELLVILKEHENHHKILHLSSSVSLNFYLMYFMSMELSFTSVVV